MGDSPIVAFLRAIDALDYDSLIEQFAPNAAVAMLFGADASGREQVGVAFRAFLGELRAATHEVDVAWNPEPGVWIAELTATYELRDLRRLGPYRRAIVLRAGEPGIEQLRIYGAHERPLEQSGRSYQEIRAPSGWLPTL
jgi:hypothetical protein